MDFAIELELKRNTGCGAGDEYYYLIVEGSVTGEYVPAVIVSPWENSTPAEGPDIDIHSCHEEGSDEQFELTASEECVVDDAIYSAYLAEVSHG